MDLIRATLHRINILEGFYGTAEAPNFISLQKILTDKKECSEIKFIHLSRYSGRQKRVNDMGGIIGRIKLEGVFSEREISVLEAGELFHIGKNTGFGLGKYTIS